MAAGSRLLRLDRHLGVVEEAVVSGNLLRIALSPDGGRLVGCLAGGLKTCLVFNTSHLAGGAVATVNDAAYEDENGIAIIATNHSFYLGSEGTPTTGDDVVVLSQYQYTAGAVRTRMYQIDVNFNRLFYGGFTRNGFIYYFVADRNPNSIRVLRACDCESGSCTSNIFWALYELELQCDSTVASTTKVCGVTVLDTFADLQEPVVIITQCELGVQASRNRVCGYRLSEIDRQIHNTYMDCRDRTLNTNTIPWLSVSPSCSTFNVSVIYLLTVFSILYKFIRSKEVLYYLQPMNECNFQNTLAIGGLYILSGNYLVNLARNAITAGLAIEVEGVSLVYVAYSDGSSSAILVVSSIFFTL